ncbi:MAG: amiC 1 [Firmicutes bacterium]|nr:amiC 1 [Bacillota bacterium]
MPLKKMLSVLMLQIIIISQLALAVPVDAGASKQDSLTRLSSVRHAVRTDGVTGEKSLRLVVEVTGPVQVSKSLSSSPTPQLIVDIKGAELGNVANNIVLDGKIASDLSISSLDKSDCRLVINLPEAIDDTECKVYTLPEDTATNRPFRVVIDIDKPLSVPNFNFTPSLKGKVIAVDPGHGGTDSGAIGPNGVQEKAVTLAVAMEVKALLEKAGAKVYMTRVNDRDVYAPNDSATEELSARAEVGNRNNADIFLSIHANSFQNSQVGGIGSYFYKNTIYGKLLAQNLQDGMVKASGLSDRGIYPANFYVLKNTAMPAVLVELAFLSNPSEEKLLNTPQFQQKLAQGIVNGVNNFFVQAAKLGGIN